MNILQSALYQEQVSRAAGTVPLMKKTVLVTGATGMIGSAIVDTLLCSDQRAGNQITVLALGRNRSRLEERFAYANAGASPELVTQDIMEPLKTETDIDYIIHAASNADPVSYALYPTETLLTNICGTNNMLTYCRDHPSARLLLTSTFEVYGRIEGQDLYAEEDSGEVDLNRIRSCYPESKRASEILLRCCHKQYGVDGVIARLCSIYGPTMSDRDSKAHAQFIRNGLAGQDIVLKSRGQQKRTYCYLMDAVTGILTVLFHGQGGEAYNIANEDGVTSIAGLADAVASICGTKVRYDLPDEVEKQGFSRPQNCILDNTKLRSLGWKGQYSLRDGLGSTLNILRETVIKA